MNNEFKRIQDYRDEVGLKNNQVPTRLDRYRCLDFAKKMNLNCTKLYRGEDLDISETINIMIESMYNILDILAEMGIPPEFFVKLYINYEENKVWPDGKIHYNDDGSVDYPIKNYTIYPEMREELAKMKAGNYEIQSSDSGDIYNRVLSLHKKLGYLYNTTPTLLSHTDLENEAFRIFNIEANYTHGDDILDDVENLIKGLMNYMHMFVKMGINPKPYLDEYIDKKFEEINIKKR